MTKKPITFSQPISGYEQLFSNAYIEFFGALLDKFSPSLSQVLENRKTRQTEIEQGKLPDFLPETKHLRESTWKIDPIPADFQDRRVEITGPPEKKIVINALNSGAKVFMADFEDSHTPTWQGTLTGQINLQQAICGTIELQTAEKTYKLNEHIAKLCMRPRGLHLKEKGLLWNGQPVSASLFDFSLYVFHNAQEILKNNQGIYLYIPKLENHLEAKWWDEVFTFTESFLNLDRGAIKVTVLIENILAAFEMDEILYSLKNHVVALNCGRWDYIFSYIKKFRHRTDCLVPDRAQVTMESPFLKAYSLLLVQTCHKRGAMAMGGMSAFIPVKQDPAKHLAAIEKVRLDKELEVKNGHDGTWVAHPKLVSVALDVFNQFMPQANQLNVLPDVSITAADLLQAPVGEITETGVRDNVAICLLYLESWLRGVGCVPIRNLMEDAATAEISRAQLWQWLHNPDAKLKDGRLITLDWLTQVFKEETEKIEAAMATEQKQVGQLKESAALLFDSVCNKSFDDFITLPAYEKLTASW